MPNRTAARNRSLYREFKLVFFLIFLCVTITAVPAVVLIELSTGSGGAINVSGSLRMMSYKLTVAVADPYASAEDRGKAVRSAVEEFWKRFTSSGLVGSVPAAADDPIRASYDLVAKRFTGEIRPLALKSIHDESARRIFMVVVGGFVDDVDDFVFALEAKLSGRLLLLKVILFLTLVGAMTVTYLMIRVMHRKIFAPLEELEQVAHAVCSGNFIVRAQAAREDSEIGRFARGFNFMVSELERLYGSLEAEVERKTEDLNRRNEGLEFLAGASEKLAVDGPELAAAAAGVLAGAADLAGARGIRFFVSADPQKPYEEASAYLFAETLGADGAGGAETLALPAAGMRGQTLGMLKAVLAEAPAPWQTYFLGMTAALLGRAVETSLRTTDEQRFAVLEERSTIARELHDSIAQSLSFSKIQLLRLRKAVESDPTGEKTRGVLKELDEGISTAYQQLREVLSAFRLQIEGTGFAGAVNAAVDAFHNRTGTPVALTNTLIGVELSSNDQVHFIQILREALSNVEKHARAKSVEVRIERLGDGGVALTVADDGVGIPERAERENHFGLSIMKERAQALEAVITIARRAEGGTTVRVVKAAPPGAA